MKNYLIYPTKTMNITQNYTDSFSHAPNSTGTPYDYPIDENCGSTSRDYFYCPCDEVIIKRVYGVGVKGTNTIWMQSTNPVVFANGEEDYCTILVSHPDDDTLKNIKTGQTFKRKEQMFLEGKDGNATGNHFHISVSKGKYVSNGWKKNNKNAWCITGTPIKPEEAFYVDKDFTTIKNTANLNFKDMPKINLPKPVTRNETIDQIEVLINNLRCRTSPKIQSNNIIGYIEKGCYNILNMSKDDKYIWYEVEDDKWVADNNKDEWLNVNYKVVSKIEEKEDLKVEDTVEPQNNLIIEQKGEDSTNILQDTVISEIPSQNEPQEDEYDYGMRKEENNPLLWFFDWLFNLIKKILKKKKD